MSAEVSVLKRRAESGSQITDTFCLPPTKEWDSIILINLSGQRNNRHILIWEAITGFVQRQPSHVFEKNFWGWVWALQSVAKSTETATATLAALQISFLRRQSNCLTSVPWFINIKVIKSSRWFIDYSWHKGLKKSGRQEGQFYWCLKHVTHKKKERIYRETYKINRENSLHWKIKKMKHSCFSYATQTNSQKSSF